MNSVSKIPPLEEQTVHIWLVNFENIPAPTSVETGVLDRDEVEAASRFVFRSHQDKFVKRRVMQRKILASYTGLHPEELKYQHNEFGKPSLGQHKLSFSASSSKDYMLLAVSRTEVGADLEFHGKDLFEKGGIASTFMHEDEIKLLESIPPENKTGALYDCWVLKEAYLKGLGVGLSVEPKLISIDFPSQQLIRKAPGTSAGPWHLRLMRYLDHYSIALASTAEETEFITFSEDDFVDADDLLKPIRIESDEKQ